MKISLIHPSRSRPERALQAMQLWQGHAQSPHELEYTLSLDTNDPHLARYRHKFAGQRLLANANRSVVDAVNVAAAQCQGEILLVMSDDFRCPPHWDAAIQKAAQGRRDWIMKTDDGLQPWLITLPLMDRAYYNRFGYIYYPGYKHMYCDTEMTAVADKLGRKIVARHLLFEHMHYSAGKSLRDSIYARAQGSWKHGEVLYEQRRLINFGL